MWHTKAIVIEDSKNLSTISLDELIRSLMTYELNLKRNEDDRKKKTIALKDEEKSKASKESYNEDNPVSDSSDPKEINFLTRRFNRFLKKKRNFTFKFR